MAIKMDGKRICEIEGVRYPAIGFGTYPLKDDVCLNAIMQAGKLGYRIIDTATFYQNLAEVGSALNNLGREHFYVISKVWPDSQTPAGLRQDIKRTLSQLKTSYLDAYLVHWPNSAIPVENTLQSSEVWGGYGILDSVECARRKFT
jgi:2,5-diketo-D-gluconate reductase B